MVEVRAYFPNLFIALQCAFEEEKTDIFVEYNDDDVLDYGEEFQGKSFPLEEIDLSDRLTMEEFVDLLRNYGREAYCLNPTKSMISKYGLFMEEK